MKNKKMIRRVLAVFVVMALTVVFAVQALASAWIFETDAKKQNTFAPRGYSISLSSTNEKWLESNYDHATEKHGNMWCASLGTADNSLEVNSVSAGTYTLHAWLDKNPMGSTLAGSGNYVNYLAVYITDSNGNTTGPTALTSLNSSYNVSISSAIRTVTDPNSQTNQWCIPFTMTLKADETYNFVFLRGFEANNGNTLVLYDGTTTGGSTGIIGYIRSTSYTTAEQTAYNSMKNTEYQYFDLDNATPLGTDASGNNVYSSVTNFYSFDYFIEAT